MQSQTKVGTPKYAVADRVAIICECSPAEWATGKIIAISVQERVSLFLNKYKCVSSVVVYVVQLDTPEGFTEDFNDEDLVSESLVPSLQSEWDSGVAWWI